MMHKVGLRKLSHIRKPQATSSNVTWTVLSSIAQVVLTAVAVFAYFYTIRPVYQNQLLSEQKAKLELQQSALTKTNVELSASIQQSRQTIAQLDSQLAELNDKLGAAQANNEKEKATRASIQADLDKMRAVKDQLDKEMSETKAQVHG
jgi:septal ring factor EnvC (AmiA/AmiB activator)